MLCLNTEYQYSDQSTINTIQSIRFVIVHDYSYKTYFVEDDINYMDSLHNPNGIQGKMMYGKERIIY